MTINKIIIQRQPGTDGYQLVAEHDDGSQRVLQGWYSGQQVAATAAQDGYPGAQIEGLPADQGGWDLWAVDEWLHESARNDVRADTSDEELAALAVRYEADAVTQRVSLAGDVLAFLRQARDEAEDE